MNEYWALIFVAGLSALIAIWLIIRKRKPLMPKDLQVKRKWWAINRENIRNWSDELLDDLRYISTWGKWRYKTPWVLMLGDSGSGKSSIAESVSSGRRQDLLLKERILANRGDVTWHFFNGGILIDPHHLADDNPGSDASTAAACTKTLAQLNDLRPERPLDGVVVALSAKVLLSGDTQAIQILAERTYRQLWLMQKQFEFSFPVYVMITQCDVIEGFDTFWSTQSDTTLNDMMGWSSPYSLDTGFSSDWVNEAFESMIDALKVLQLETTTTDSIDELVSENDNLQDKFFLFPRRFQSLQKPLRIVLKYVLRPSAYHSNFYFRGIYFSGVVSDNTENEYEGVEVRKDVRFLNRFFEEKVFVERNLAEPTRSGVWSRNKRIRQIQAAFVTAFSILCLLLAGSAVRIEDQKDIFIDSMNLIQQDSNTLALKKCSDHKLIYELLDSISHLQSNWTYASIPFSWIDNSIPNASANFLANSAFEDVVFPNLRCHLEERADKIKEKKILAVTPGSATRVISSMRDQMVDYARSILEFERNYKLFISLNKETPLGEADTSLANLDKLAQYLHNAPLPDSVYNVNSPLLSSLAAVEPEDTPKPIKNLRQDVAKTLTTMAYQLTKENNSQMEKGPDLLKKLDKPGANLLTETRSFTWWLKWVEQEWLNELSDQNPCKSAYFELKPILTELKEKFNYSEILSNVQNSFGSKECFKKNMGVLTNISIAPDPALVSEKNGKRQMSDSARHELRGLDKLLVLDFMQRPANGDFKCQLPLRGWNPQKLAKASAYIREYFEFASDNGVENSKPSNRPLFDRLAREQLMRVLNGVMQDAQIQSSVGDNPAADVATALDSELRKSSRDFDDSLKQLLFVLRMYQRLEFDTSMLRITQCTRDFTTDSLTNIDSLSDLSRLYQPSYVGDKPSYVSDATETNVKHDVAFYNLGSVPKTKAYLDQQFHRAKVLGAYAKPFVNFLKNSQGLNNTALPNKQILDYWEQTLTQIRQKQQFATPTSQPAFLDALFVNDLQSMSDSNCSELIAKQHPPAVGNDLFSDRRVFLLQQSWLYCEDYHKAESFTEYSKFAKGFNRTLKGQFPFGNELDQEATISSVRNTLMEYATEKEVLQGYAKQLPTAERTAMDNYLKKMDTVSEFMKSNLTAEDPQPVILNISFRAKQKESDGSNQLVSWRISNDYKEINFPSFQPGETMQMEWRYGQPLILELDWAELSDYTPVIDNAQPDMKVDGKKVTFKAEGNWALFKWLHLHKPGRGPAKDRNNVPEKYYLEFAVPVKTKKQGKDDKDKKVYLYLAISASGKDAKTKKQVAINIPTDFPLDAPVDW